MIGHPALDHGDTDLHLDLHLCLVLLVLLLALSVLKRAPAPAVLQGVGPGQSRKSEFISIKTFPDQLCLISLIHKL